MKNKLFNSSNWNAKQFYTYPELNKFIQSISSDFIGKTLDKIMVMGHIYMSVGYDNKENYCVRYSGEDKWFIEENHLEKEIQTIPTHKVSLSLDEPLILCFNNNHFEINYCESSNAQIGINTLNYSEYTNPKDVSNYFAKNIVGKKLLNIKIKYTSIPNEYVSHYRKIGEEMYDKIIFIFEGGQQLEIFSDIDYMALSEKTTWQEQQDLAKKVWNDYYDSTEYLDDNEKTFKDLIAESSPINGDNVLITANDEYFLGFLDYDFVINNNGNVSKCFYGFAVNDMNFLWDFLEALTMSKEDCYLCCDEEGPETHFFVQHLNENKIRFIHISDREQNAQGIFYERYKVRQDFITNKYNFIKQFYTCLKQPLKHFSIEDASNVCLDEFAEFNKDSEIVRKYLEANKYN